jgi:hypothetical protein
MAVVLPLSKDQFRPSASVAETELILPHTCATSPGDGRGRDRFLSPSATRATSSPGHPERSDDLRMTEILLILSKKIP